MSELKQLLNTVKHILKQQGKTYRDLALALDLSEASIKRLFSASSDAPVSLERIIQISHFLGFSLMELTQEANLSQAKIQSLTSKQELELVSDAELLLVAVCAINQWRLDDIIAVYNLSEAACVKKLLQLDKLGLITLLPGNRIRLNMSRDFTWLPGGPIQNYFRHEGMPDFLNNGFHSESKAFNFTHGMLTEAATEKLLVELKQLQKKFADLHAESINAPLHKRHGTGILLAMRRWEPHAFLALRRGT